jgi:hypothetical protein
MKTIAFLLTMLWVYAPNGYPQDAGFKKVDPEKVNQWIGDFQFILIPANRFTYEEPYMSFMLISGDRFVYQTQGSKENPGERRIDKTVIGRITSHQMETNPNGKVCRIKLQVETDAGVSFAAGFNIKPTGEASSWISRNHSSSKKHISGWLASPGETRFEVGPVSTDLALFPWEREKTSPSWYEYLLGSRPYQYDYEYHPSGGKRN